MIFQVVESNFGGCTIELTPETIQRTLFVGQVGTEIKNGDLVFGEHPGGCLWHRIASIHAFKRRS